jgi:hypothetical protein
MNFIKHTLLFLNVCFVVGWSIQHWMTTESDHCYKFPYLYGREQFIIFVHVTLTWLTVFFGWVSSASFIVG